MKQLKTKEEIVALLDLSRPIQVRSARQNGSTYTSDILANIIAEVANCTVRREELDFDEVDHTTNGAVNGKQGMVEIFVKSGCPFITSAPNYVHSFLGKDVLSMLIHTLNGLYVAHWKRDRSEPGFEKIVEIIDGVPVDGLSEDFVAFKEAGVEFRVLDRVLCHLDLTKPITVIGRRPRQGASTFASVLATTLATRKALPLHMFSQLSDRDVVLNTRLLREERSNLLDIEVDSCHFAAGLETVQKAEFIMSERLGKIKKGVVFVDELNPQFQIPGAAAASTVASDIFTSSAQIRFTNKLREQLEEQCANGETFGIIAGTCNAPGELTISTNTIVTYLNNDTLSILAIGEDAYSVCHMTPKFDKESKQLVIDPYNDGRVPSSTDVSEYFERDITSVIRYYEDLKAAKEFEKESAEISAKAELEKGSVSDLSDGLL